MKARTGDTIKKTNIFVRMLAFLLTAALVFGALLLVVYRDKLNVDAVKRWISYRSVDLDQGGQAQPFTHAGGNRLSVACLDRGAVFASLTGAHFYSFAGTQYAEEITPLENPVLSASGRTAVVYDAGGEDVFVFREQEEIFSLLVEDGGGGASEILSARVNDAGWLAVTSQESGYKGSVTVYNPDYAPVIQINLSSTFVVDAAISPDGKTVAVITMGQEGGTFQSRLLIYPVDAKEPTAQLSLGDVLVLDMDYESDVLWILGEDEMLLVSRDGTQVTSWPYGQYYLKTYTLGGDGFAAVLLSRYRAASAERMVVLDAQGNIIGEFPLQGQTLGVDAKGRYLGQLGSDGLIIYSCTVDVSEYAVLSDTQGARTLAMTGDGAALLADDENAWLYSPS